jgi:hypothetical protein
MKDLRVLYRQLRLDQQAERKQHQTNDTRCSYVT